MRKVIFLCEGIQHVRFFCRMEKAFFNLGYVAEYIVLDYSVYLQLKQLTKNKIFIVKRFDKATLSPYNCDNILQAKDVLEGTISLDDARIVYNSVTKCCENIGLRAGFDLIIASQGILTAEIAIRDFAKLNSISIIFFELANIPGKTFWDIDGSNAKSYLYKNIGILDEYQCNEKDYMTWKVEYIKNNLKQHIVKQRVNIKSFNYKYGLISRCNIFFTGINLRKFDLLLKIRHFIKSRCLKIEYDKIDLRKNSYIFFPMQVASDSQIILNSDIDLFDALEYAIDVSKKNGLPLVVKLHPAERDLDVIYKVLKLRKKYRFKIVDDNTFFVIKNAERIITINSTVALEAMILNKNVEILGRSYYKYLNCNNRIQKYIMNYLINIDFFDNKDVAEIEIKKLLERSKNEYRF